MWGELGLGAVGKCRTGTRTRLSSRSGSCRAGAEEHLEQGVQPSRPCGLVMDVGWGGGRGFAASVLLASELRIMVLFRRS